MISLDVSIKSDTKPSAHTVGGISFRAESRELVSAAMVLHVPDWKLTHPEWRARLFQPSAQAHRRDAKRQAGRIVGLHRYCAQRCRSERRFEAGRGDTRGEAPQRLLLLHADDRIVVAGHADIGHVGGAAGKNLMIGSGH